MTVANLAAQDVTYDDEPDAADAAAESLEEASADGRLGQMMLREEDAPAVEGLADLEVDETTWRRTGRVATAEATTGGRSYRVWMVEVDGVWRVSHTSDVEGAP